MISALILLLQRELQDRFPSPWALCGEVGMISLGLAIYWYTSQSFTSLTGNYFNYLVIGELTLFMPLLLLQGILRVIKTALSEGTFEVFLVMPRRSQTPLICLSLAAALRDGLSALLIGSIAVIGFRFRVPLSFLWDALYLQLLSLPLFFGLGLLSASILIRFGRGESVIVHLSTLASILAGVYFPITVLPASFQALSQWLSPYSLLLQNTRTILEQGWNPAEHLKPTLLLGLGGLTFLTLGYIALGSSLAALRRDGLPLALRSR